MHCCRSCRAFTEYRTIVHDVTRGRAPWRVRRAWKRGYQSRADAVSRLTNPYIGKKGHKAEAQAWFRGWHSANGMKSEIDYMQSIDHRQSLHFIDSSSIDQFTNPSRFQLWYR